MENLGKKDRIILHVDGDAFYASVEETVHPEYKLVPMAVCGDPKSRRGIILSKNQLAKEKGVLTAETIWQAKQKCPNLTLAPARHSLYEEFCDRLNSIYEDYTDQVEKLSIDESFLDITGSIHLFSGSPKDIADKIRARVEKETGVTVSVGVSYNKIFAKMGSDLRKPNQTSVITGDNYKEVIWTLPAGKLYSVGKVAAKKLSDLEIFTIGDIAQTDPRILEQIMGKVGIQYYNYANGLDSSLVSRVDEARAAKSIGNGRTFKRNLETIDDIRLAVGYLADTVATRLRNHGLKCNTVQISIKDPQFKVINRQSVTEATWLAADISREAMALVEASWKIGMPIRMLTITGANLIESNKTFRQISFFNDDNNKAGSDKKEKLEKTMNIIRKKHGKNSILAGNTIKNDIGINDKYIIIENGDEEPV